MLVLQYCNMFEHVQSILTLSIFWPVTLTVARWKLLAEEITFPRRVVPTKRILKTSNNSSYPKHKR
jgi:hypothetical protein